MTTKPNHVAWCMDSLRWDVFQEADIPNLKGFTKYQKVYSRAGCTIPSVFSMFMNIQWYEAKKEKLIPWLGQWKWVPTDLEEHGYHTALYTSNPMLKLYRPLFEKGFDDYKVFNAIFPAKEIVSAAIEFFNQPDPKFVFLLFMETHHPYMNTEGARHGRRYTFVHQKKAVEVLDQQFGRFLDAVDGTGTDIAVFSDHGDLFKEKEGDYGHGPGKFHRKLFEIPLGRKTV